MGRESHKARWKICKTQLWNCLVDIDANRLTRKIFSGINTFLILGLKIYANCFVTMGLVSGFLILKTEYWFV